MTALHPRALAAAGVLSLGALVLSGCSSSSGTATTAQPNSSASGSAQNSAYRDCLAQHGVTLPSGRPGGPGGSARPSGARPSGVRPSGGFGGFGGASANPSMQAAMQACASVRPSGAAGFGGGGGGFNSTDMAAFTSCMKDHGVTVPATGGTRALNTADPKTAAAYNTCKVLLPTRSGSPSPSPTA